MVIQTSLSRSHQSQPTVKKSQVHDGIRKTPTPPIQRQHQQTRTGIPTTVHIQMGTKDVKVVPIHIPVQGNPATGTISQQRVVGGEGLGGGGGGGASSVAGAGYLLPMVMARGNLITVPANISNTQRQSPGLTEVNVQQGLNQRVTPPPPTVSRTTPSPHGRQLVVPPSTVNRNTSPRSSPVPQTIPQLLITPAQAQLLTMSGKLTAAQSQDIAQALASQHKLVSQSELNRLQSVAQVISSQPHLSSSMSLSKSTELATGATPAVQKRPQSVPSTVTCSTADLQNIIHPSQISSIPQQQQQQQQQQVKQVFTAAQVSAAAGTQRRLSAITTPQRFFGSNVLTVPNNGERPQRPSSHPNLPLNSQQSNPEQNPNLRVVAAPSVTPNPPQNLVNSSAPLPQLLVPNGIDLTNANGEIHTQLELRQAPSPLNQTTLPVFKIEQKQQQQLLLQQQQQQQQLVFPKSILEAELTVGRDIQVQHNQPTQNTHRNVVKSYSDVSKPISNHKAENDNATIPKFISEKTVGLSQGQLNNGHAPVKIKQEEGRVRLVGIP